MSKSIRTQLLNGIVWSTFEKVSVKGTSFVIGIILARLLSPEDYGLLGMLGVFIAVSNVFIESGLAKALIQKKNCTDTDYSTVFFVNIIISLVLYAILFFASPFIASFYREPSLSIITKVLALNFIIGSFNIVQRAKLMIAFDFRSLAQINLLGTIMGGVVGIAMAYLEWGVWSLIAQVLTSTLVMSLFFPFYSNWKPLFVFSMNSLKRLFGFGSKLLASGVITVVYNNISTICIGKFYQSTQLGFYTRATQFSEMIAWTINDILGTVTFPALCQLQDEREKMLTLYRKSLFYTAVVIFPVMILLSLLAKPLILLLLTEKWLPCVFLLQILCLARMFTPLSAINMNILNAVGRSDLFIKLDVIKMSYSIVALIITIPMGMKAIVIGNLLVTFIGFFVNAYFPGRMFGYGAMQQIIDFRHIIYSVMLMLIVVAIYLQFVSNPWLQLFGGGFLGVLVYLIFCIKFRVLNFELIRRLKK